MTIKTLYKYERPDGGFTVSTEKPSMEYTEIYRIIAEEGKLVTNENIAVICIDVYDTNDWYEIDDFEQDESDTLDSDEISAKEFMALIEEAL